MSDALPGAGRVPQGERMNTTWDYLEFNLNTRGIPAEVEEIVTDDYEFDPWRPAPNTEAVRITITKDDAAKLAGLILDQKLLA